MRCEHIHGKDGAGEGVKGCNEGCYVLEKGGEEGYWRCASENCQGHIYCGEVLMDEAGRCCFGKKGEIMVCLKR
jgi:hypothetical protein